MPMPMHNPPPGFAMPTEEQRRRVALKRAGTIPLTAELLEDAAVYGRLYAAAFADAAALLDFHEARISGLSQTELWGERARPLTSAEQEVIDGGGELDR